MCKNTVWHKGHISRKDRNRLNRHESGAVWFTGLSASGKSTIAHHVEKELHQKSIRSYVFDGDNIRHGLNANLGFSPEDRTENIRRIVEVSRLFADAGIIVLASFITPMREQRAYIRERFRELKYLEVYVKCSIEECVRRDPKGLYRKAIEGTISNYTGISAPFEEPETPDLVLDTCHLDVEECVKKVLAHLKERNFLGL